MLTTNPAGYGDDMFALMTPRRVALMTLGLLVIIIGFVLMAHSDGRLDRLAAVLVVVGFALLLFTTARPGQAALARYWSRYERK
ncbi:hypothetical protein DEJ12_00760 [Curtobacterium sp. MCLR17_059]|uniref:hypothetical protein n=2 Tax=Curtobacterium TaxID=2034 RepID=UPI000DA89AF1|nr:hypothetical protein [Curtobacterium sp. MCLR17_058]PZE72223.1 hypothetical protein DEJ12_00760 [Curtobacterium sp. MCLR17_059]PZF52165.1 hypothetical protein DEJ10_08055 [Curtobacterium sp. MCLR17_057]WIB42920.1 hypothetical protein DEJ11_01035 [Curtobacterium sp. MCLR17_058]